MANQRPARDRTPRYTVLSDMQTGCRGLEGKTLCLGKRSIFSEAGKLITWGFAINSGVFPDLPTQVSHPAPWRRLKKHATVKIQQRRPDWKTTSQWLA